MKKIRVKIIVKVQDAWGESCLREFRTLKEGTTLIGTYCESSNSVDVKWEGNDGVLWVGSNCEIVKRMPKAHTTHHLPKGFVMDCYCIAQSYQGHVWGGGSSRGEAIEEAIEEGHSRDTFRIVWQVQGYNKEGEYYGCAYGEGDTKAEAIENFWADFEARNI